MLNPGSPIPLYRQLSDIILDKIRSGAYASEARIPSEHRLAAEYGIGRPTVRQAIDVLVRKRLLVRKRGSGTFVARELAEVDLFSLAGTMSSFSKKGIHIDTRILQKTRLKTVGQNPENPFSNQEAFYFSRLSTVDAIPILLEEFYLHPIFFKGINAFDMQGQRLSEIVYERYYMRPTHGKQNFRIGYVSGKRAGYLDVTSKVPLLVVNRFLHFPQAENAIYSELFCRTDRFVFSQMIGGLSDEA